MCQCGIANTSSYYTVNRDNTWKKERPKMQDWSANACVLSAVDASNAENGESGAKYSGHSTYTNTHTDSPEIELKETKQNQNLCAEWDYIEMGIDKEKAEYDYIQE